MAKVRLWPKQEIHTDGYDLDVCSHPRHIPDLFFSSLASYLSSMQFAVLYAKQAPGLGSLRTGP